MTEPGAHDTVRIDLTYREFTDKEIKTVNAILKKQLPGYALVLGVQGNDCDITAPDRDVSPPLSRLQEFLGPKVEYEATEIECPLPPQPVYDMDSDLRLYPVRPEEAADNVKPVPVVIAYSARQVVGFG